MPALFMSHLYLWHFNGLLGSHRGGGGKERLPGKYCSLNYRGEWKKAACQMITFFLLYFWVKFTEVSGFHSPRDSSKRQSGTQHSPEMVLTSASGFNYLSLRGLQGGSITRKPLTAPHKPPTVTGEDAVFMSTVRMFQAMHSNTFHWWPRDQIHPFLHHFIPEAVHWEMKMRINTLTLTKQLFLPRGTG